MATEHSQPKTGWSAASPERWHTMSRIVDQALDLPPAERQAFIEAQCNGHADLRRDVEQFLEACAREDHAHDFLNEPAATYAAPLLAEVPADADHEQRIMHAAVTAALAPRYAIQRELGRGGMATVYLAHDAQHDRRVAIKVMHPDLARQVGAERFLREIRITASLRHLHIVPLFDSGQAGGLLYFVMPCIDGESLEARRAREQQLSLQDALWIVRDVAGALDYAHANGIVHRDVKPQNILIESGHALVTDFGVARAITANDGGSVSIGVRLGTPAYMSPEQAAGDSEIGAQSDVYSLGIVLYEMLAGQPPFTGDSAQEVLLQHICAPVPDIRALRPDLGAEVRQVIERALAKSADERFATPGALAEALASAVTRATITPPRYLRYQSLALYAGAIVLALWLLTSGVRVAQRFGAAGPVAIDTTRLVLFPLEGSAGATSTVSADDLLRELFGAWTGLHVIDAYRTSDAVRGRRSMPSIGESARLASTLGAGRFVRGRVAPRGDGAVAMSATLFDVRTRTSLHQATVDVPADPVGARRAYDRLVAALLRHRAPSDTVLDQGRSASLPATQAADQAHEALENWDLARSDALFQRALGFDPTYARANLWLAQVRAWRALPVADWSSIANRAQALAGQLSPRERRLAAALASLAHGRFADACAEYDALRALNDRDFAASFGLGQCRTMDKLVVPDSRSPSRWRFRSSYHAAVTSYRHALEILPSVYRGFEDDGFARLRSLLFTTNTLLAGYGAGPDRSLFHARPGWAGDTLILVPYPWQRVLSGEEPAIPEGFERVIVQQRMELRRLAAGWSAAFPQSSGPKHAVALALALLDDPRAIDTLRVARQLASDSRRLHLAVLEVLLTVKFGAPSDLNLLRRGRVLADSLLASAPAGSEAAKLLAPVAVFTGRCALAERLMPLIEQSGGGAGTHLYVQSQRLLARTSMGCRPNPDGPTLRSLAEEVERDRASTKDSGAEWLENVVLLRPVLLDDRPDSAVVARLSPGVGGDLAHAWRALLRGDEQRARAALTRFGAQYHPAIGVTADMGLPEARLWAALHDTAQAVRWLERALAAARTGEPEILADPVVAASLVRAMVLRADLAWGRGDRETARRWAKVVDVLWSGGDSDLSEIHRRITRYLEAR